MTKKKQAERRYVPTTNNGCVQNKFKNKCIYHKDRTTNQKEKSETHMDIHAIENQHLESPQVQCSLGTVRRMDLLIAFSFFPSFLESGEI